MGLTSEHRQMLSRKAADNSLEVEHLLKVAEIGDATDVAFLRALKVEHGWSDTGREGGELVAPMGRWADTVCRFLEDGYPGLEHAAKESDRAAEFCIIVLEDLKTAASVSALLAIGGPVIERPADDLKLAVRMADGFNVLLSFRGAPVVTSTVEAQVRDFLHRLLAVEMREVQRASVVCALWGVGDAQSATLVESLPPFQGRWAGLEQAAARQIRQRDQRAKDDTRMTGPAETVRGFIAAFYDWNAAALARDRRVRELSPRGSPPDKAATQVSEAEYDALLSKFCVPSVRRRGIAFGSSSAHDPDRETVESETISGENAVIVTRHFNRRGFVKNHEFHLVQQAGEWRITSLLYLGKDGKGECL